MSITNIRYLYNDTKAIGVKMKKKNNNILKPIASIIALTVILSGAVMSANFDFSEKPNSKNSLYVTTTTDKTQYDVGEPVEVTIKVTNGDYEPVTIYFPDAQLADFEVSNDTCGIYVWSHDKCFAQVIIPLTIGSYQTVDILTDYWLQVDFDENQVECGDYCIVGWMVDYFDAFGDYPEIYGNSVHIRVELNHPPFTPSNPVPPNGATNVTEGGLSWTGGDPDPGDIVTYDIYFGTTCPPPLVAKNQTTTEYNPGLLEYSTQYYWKIVAWDNHGATTEGPIWSFTTEEEDEGEPVIKIEPPPFPSPYPGLRVFIFNIGDAVATDVEWSFRWYGGWILGERFSDKARIDAGEIPSICIQEGRSISSLKFGLGNVAIIIRAECAEGSSDEVVLEARMMGFFLMIT